MGIADRTGLIGQTVDGRYKVTGLIGEGGMGTVYRAQHVLIGRPVAIKCLHIEYANNHQAVQGFFDEARAAATLDHPNIAEATDMGELKDGSPYLVLELLDGRSLHDEIEYVGRFSVRRSLRIAKQIAAGVQAAHDAGIIHRDLKSDNVFLIERDNNPDHVKIFDFGVARILGQQPARPGVVVGTPEFMPPEQITDPDSIDVRADVYALGSILYHMLSGKVPYGEETLPADELLGKVLSGPPRPITGIPEDLRVLVEDAMARDRDARIGSISELLARIDRIVLPGSSSPSITVPIPRRAKAEPPFIVSVPPHVPASRSLPGLLRAPRTRWILIALLAIGAIGAFFIMQASKKTPSKPLAAPAATPAPVVADEPTPSTDSSRVVGRPHDTEPVAPVAPPPRVAAALPPVAHPASHPPPQHPATHPKKPDKSSQPTPTTSEPEPKIVKVETKPEVVKTESHPVAVPKPPVPPTVAVTTPQAPKPGTIDVVATRTAIHPHLTAIQRCYERAKMDDLSLAGSVTIRISIGPDGSVTNAAVAKSTLGSPAAEHCITQEISSWHLPEPSGGVASALIYPFVFE